MTAPATPPQQPRPVSHNELIRAALVIVALLIGLQLLWSARLLLFTAFLGILFGLAAARVVDVMAVRVPVRRGILAPIVVFGAVGSVLVILFWAGPTLISQSRDLRNKLPEAVGNIESWMEMKQPALLDLLAPPDTMPSGDTLTRQAPDRDPRVATETASKAPGGRLFGVVKKRTEGFSTLAFGVLQSAIAVVAGLVLLIFLALYIAIDPLVYQRGVLLLLPLHLRPRFEHLMKELAVTLRTWFATQLIAMVVIGAITTTALALIGVRAAIPLGILAGLFEFVPNIGPILSAIPAVLMGFVDSPQMALTVAGVYWAIQFLENNLLIPYLMREQLDLPPALTLVTQVTMAYVFGFLGLFVAIPLLATAMVSVRVLWIGEDEYQRSGNEPPPAENVIEVLPLVPPQPEPEVTP